jgi:hypothetical protein
VIVHHIDGSLAAADASFHNPARQASAHFGVDFDGHTVQWVDTSDVAYAQCQGNWQGWVSIENASDPNQPNLPLTVKQVASVQAIIAWLGTPLTPATSMTSGGVGYHRQFPGDCSTAWGQTSCPGDGIVAQIPAICSTVPTDEEFDMFVMFCAETQQVGVVSEFRVSGYPRGEWVGKIDVNVTKAEFDAEVSSRSANLASLHPVAGGPGGGSVTVAVDSAAIAAGITAGIKAL